MDALCTAAAMMADDDEGVEVVETEVANQVSAFKTLPHEREKHEKIRNTSHRVTF